MKLLQMRCSVALCSSPDYSSNTKQTNKLSITNHTSLRAYPHGNNSGVFKVSSTTPIRIDWSYWDGHKKTFPSFGILCRHPCKVQGLIEFESQWVINVSLLVSVSSPKPVPHITASTCQLEVSTTVNLIFARRTKHFDTHLHFQGMSI